MTEVKFRDFPAQYAADTAKIAEMRKSLDAASIDPDKQERATQIKAGLSAAQEKLDAKKSAWDALNSEAEEVCDPVSEEAKWDKIAEMMRVAFGQN